MASFMLTTDDLSNKEFESAENSTVGTEQVTMDFSFDDTYGQLDAIDTSNHVVSFKNSPSTSKQQSISNSIATEPLDRPSPAKRRNPKSDELTRLVSKRSKKSNTRIHPYDTRARVIQNGISEPVQPPLLKFKWQHFLIHFCPLFYLAV